MTTATVAVDDRPEQVRLGETCKNCKWWHPENTYGDGRGECRKNEPMIATVMLSTDSYNKDKTAAWPETSGAHWCGQFSMKAPAFMQEHVPQAQQPPTP